MGSDDVEDEAGVWDAKADSDGAFVHQLIAVHPIREDQTVPRQHREFAEPRSRRGKEEEAGGRKQEGGSRREEGRKEEEGEEEKEGI